MADLPENIDWTPGVYQLETSDPVLGGPDGIDNLQAKQLANRTRWLKDQLDKIVSGATSIGKAIKLATARTISVSGAATGSTLFDGSANANMVLTLADSGASAGTYTKITINAKGLVVGGSSMLAADIPALDWSKITFGKPTTLAGYGIVDAVAVGQYGVGMPLGLNGGSDLNTLLQDGTYAYTSGTPLGHAPMEGASHVLVRGRAEYPHQEVRRIYQNRYFYRAANKVYPTAAEADWEPWVEMLHTGNMVQATQAEAEAGVSSTAWMSALRVAQAIAKTVTQATEAAFGWLKIATQAQVATGTDDATAVTPKKLRAAQATQAEAEAGAIDTKLMTPLRGLQLIRAAAAQATEALLGTLRIGTQIEVDGGALDTVVVTPKKLRATHATQAEAEAGTDSTKLMNPLRVFQAIAKVVTQATETAFGWLKIATQAQVTTGTDDATAVTPKKLRAAQATQAEAEAGVLDSKLMTPLRVLQLIRNVTALATEALCGVLRVGTQAEVDAGALDMVAVTPKKMRWGFAFSYGSNGYLVFPTWLGGLIIQWSNGQINAGAGTVHITLPIEFTSSLVAYSINTSAAGVIMTGQGASPTGIDVNARTVASGVLAIPPGIVSYTFFCIGK
ncbi:hypothetical protein QEM11_000791 [Pseudomonas putida]|nr:hypothetical protein [Pseudomonas putida]